MTGASPIIIYTFKWGPDLDTPRTSIDDILLNYPSSRENLIPILHAVQEAAGFLSQEDLARVAEHLGLSNSEVYGVATFYSRFKFKPSGKRCIRVCRGTACHVKGAGEVLKEVEKRLGIKPGETTPDGRYSLETEACFGSCALAPVVVTDEQVHGRMTPSKAAGLLRGED
jgi:NADH-quinone oxidoreductase E subunit